MPKTFVERIKEGAENMLDKFLDKLPNDDEVTEKVGGIFSFLGKKIDKIDKKLGSEFNKFERKFREDPSPKNLTEAFDDLKEGVKNAKNSDFCNKLINFLGSAIDLIKSIGKPKEDRTKVWDHFTQSAKELGKAISKSLGGERTH